MLSSAEHNSLTSLATRYLSFRLFSSSYFLCIKTISLSFALHLAIHRYREWYTIRYEHGNKLVEGEMSGDNSLSMVDQSQYRTYDER